MTAHLFLDLRAAKGEAPLKIAISHNEKTAYIPTGVKLLPTQWDKDKWVVNHQNKKELNVFLRSQLSAVDREMLRLRTMGIRGTAVEIRDRILCEINPDARAKKESDTLFLARMKRYASLQTKKQTKDLYEWTIKKLSEFDNRLSSRRFEDIDHDYLNDLVNHCQDLSINSRSILLRNIRAVINDAIDAGITKTYPFRRFSIKSEKTRKKALSLSNMRVLKQSNNEYKDIFLLMFYLRGINAIDLFSAKWSQIVNGRLEYRRSKVGTLFSVKIEPEAWEIINKYRGKEYILNILERNPKYRVYLTNMNRGLKRLGKRFISGKVVEGAFPMLSTNWARHSWATIGINIGISKDVISRGMGHSFGPSVTDTYIDFDMKLVDDANRKIIDSLL